MRVEVRGRSAGKTPSRIQETPGPIETELLAAA